ncbi:kinase-like domain-containing protein [Rhizophagus clarus]|uniref:Kinase-like domain-containing protein n=1 Tax=Rhizophagus clarus TaxID=94130 RepID=A0A8H3KYG0_9GLOM|nr:kinase-like domain-containing protein [Rhizophagus clarus]
MDSFIKIIKKLIGACDCNRECNAKRFKKNFKNWTSGDYHIDRLIRNIQSSDHSDGTCQSLEWIPYNRFYEIEFIEDDEDSKLYRAKWIDGYIDEWDNNYQNWKRKDRNMLVALISLKNFEVIVEYINEQFRKACKGITQDLKTKNYMIVTIICEECNNICSGKFFELNFRNWTSGNDLIDKLIQDAQLSAHDNDNEIFKKVLEWIPYDRFYDVECIVKDEFDNKVYRARWIDGYIYKWNHRRQNWKRKNQNIFVNLKSLGNPADVTLEFINKVTTAPHKVYGITQNSKTKDYMIVWNEICKKCDCLCNAIHFKLSFRNWTSGNNYIDKFIQYTQLSVHNNLLKVLEWIPYNKFVDGYIAKDGFEKVYRARWIDGYIYRWDHKQQSWNRKDQNMFVNFKNLDNPADVTLEFINKAITVPHKIYGITQNPETKNYMVVWNEICEECNCICNASRFKLNFGNWSSGNNYIDKFIQDAQLTTHKNLSKALEWISYNRFYDIEYVIKSGFGKVYRAKWIDGCIDKWDNKRQNWQRKDQNMFVALKNLDNPADITLEFINEVILNHKLYGITQDLKTKKYMVIFGDKCERCEYASSAIQFWQNFKTWTSGNYNIDKLIQEAQLSLHSDYKVFRKALEWIPYNRFYNVEFIAKGGFGKVYRARWSDGYIDRWDSERRIWKRKGQNMFVALKSLNNSKNVTLEFMNEITLHYKLNLNKRIIKFYGITQDPKTKNYIMVLEYAVNGSLRNYLDKCYDKLSLSDKINYLHCIAHGLKDIHEKGLIHRDLHIGNILRLKCMTCIADMGMLISGLPPYNNMSHDNNLAIKICKGFRPRFNFKVPRLIVELIKRCLDANPLNRPKAEEIKKLLSKWFEELEAIYTSRLFDFNNLPEPKNTDDYYKEHDNIISLVSSESLLSDNCRLNNNNNKNLPEYKNSFNYYEENDNIINMNSSETESQQINILQLNISKNDLSRNSKDNDKI